MKKFAVVTESEGGMFLTNVANHLQGYTVA